MKIAVISDIHGNMEALEAVLDDIKNQFCDKIFCLGDYAMAGPEPDKTVSKFMSLQNELDITMIQGNTDLMIAEYTDKTYEDLKKTAPVMSEALKEDVNILTPEQKEFLKNLEPNKTLEVEGVKVMLVHGSPRKNNENIFPDTPINEVETMLKDVDADVVLCGHTHIPCGFHIADSKTVINVGSVGRPFTEKPKSCYLTMIINEGRCLFEHRFVKYDNETASEKIMQRGFNGCEKLAKTLIEPSERHF